MPSSAVSQPRTRQETLQEVEKMYRLAGEAGVEDAWFELAALYAEGKWVRKDDERARSLLREGVERGSSRACRALAHLMTKEVQAPPAPSSLTLGGGKASGLDAGRRETLLTESLRLLERGAELGSSECAFSAGMRYLLQPPAPEEETEPLNASLDMSLDPSSSSRASPVDPAVRARQEHIKKWAVEPSNELAAKWFGIAAEGGNALAMMNLARMYLEDRVVPATAGTEAASSPRQAQLAHASDLYTKILAKAMGPEGQRSKAMAEVQAKMAGAKGAGSGVTGQGLDDLGARAQEGLRLVTEEMSMLSRG
jgi:TPR repeat protein